MIVEIAGMAGAGKSTVALALPQRDPAIRSDFRLRWRYVLPAFYARVVLTLPAYLSRYRSKGQVLWPALRQMVYLEKLHHVLSKSDGATVLLLDQGPVFWLAYLYAFGFEGIRDQSLALWWTRMIADWASVLDVIFWVDAQDAVLLERIRNRSKWHRVQDMSEQEARELLARYREAYRQVISGLTSDGGPRVHCFFTDQEPLDQIVDKILNELKPGRGYAEPETCTNGTTI